LLLAAAALLVACAGQPPPGPRVDTGPILAFTSCRLLASWDAPAIPDAVVLVRGERIIAAGPSAATTVPARR
jgi:hypothetical protein